MTTWSMTIIRPTVWANQCPDERPFFAPMVRGNRRWSVKRPSQIREVPRNKKQYLELLLLADEQEDTIDHYLERGTMYVLEDNGVKAECVVTDEGGIQLVDMVYLQRTL